MSFVVVCYAFSTVLCRAVTCQHLLLYVLLVCKDVSAVKFSPEAFTDPARYLNVPESTSNVTQMLNYLDGRSVTNRYFKVG